MYLDFPDNKFLSSNLWTHICDKFILRILPHIPYILQILNHNHANTLAFLVQEDNT
jgi:hypothetical protein